MAWLSNSGPTGSGLGAFACSFSPLSLFDLDSLFSNFFILALLHVVVFSFSVILLLSDLRKLGGFTTQDTF